MTILSGHNRVAITEKDCTGWSDRIWPRNFCLTGYLSIDRYLRAYLPSKIRVILGIAQNVWDQIFIRYIYFWLHWCYLPRNKMHIKSKSRLVIATLRWMVLSRRGVNGTNGKKYRNLDFTPRRRIFQLLKARFIQKWMRHQCTWPWGIQTGSFATR